LVRTATEPKTKAEIDLAQPIGSSDRVVPGSSIMSRVAAVPKRSSLTPGWALLALFLAAAILTGCNTARGVGQDVENAGEAVKDAVD
jgi:predicted small secreted protein